MIEPLKLKEALQILQSQPADGLEYPVWLVVGNTAEPLAQFLAAYLQQKLPDRRVQIRTGLFGDLTGNTEKALAAALPAVIILEWAVLDAPDWWRIGKSLLLEMRGTQPLAEIHVNDRRKNRLTLSENEGLRSFYRLACSLEFQPELHGLMTCSWLYCPLTARLTPRIAWLREFFLREGALLFPVGPAPADSGFLVGSEERRKLYEQGSYRPAMTCVLSPRSRMNAWAKTYSDSDSAS